MASQPKSPCIRCSDRFVNPSSKIATNCHDICKPYIDYFKEQRLAIMSINSEYDQYVKAQCAASTDKGALKKKSMGI